MENKLPSAKTATDHPDTVVISGAEVSATVKETTKVDSKLTVAALKETIESGDIAKAAKETDER